LPAFLRILKGFLFSIALIQFVVSFFSLSRGRQFHQVSFAVFHLRQHGDAGEKFECRTASLFALYVFFYSSCSFAKMKGLANEKKKEK